VANQADHPLDELAVRNAHATLTRILGAIEEYVYTGEFLPDDRYRVVFAGPCREQFLGTSIEEARTATWRYYVHPDDVDLFDTAHVGALGSGRLDVEYRLIGADGVLRWVRDRGRVREEDDRCFLDGSILDVTEIHVIQKQLEAARAEADRLAHVDHLTGLENRRSLGTLQGDRSEHPGGLLSIDIDHFKEINDRYGHAAGDAVLIAVADRLRETVRSTDTIVRMGGEEFLVVLRDIPEDQLLPEIGEAVRRRISLEPIRVAGSDITVTVSVGVAALAPADDFEAGMRHADDALYEAKQAGRNRVV